MYIDMPLLEYGLPRSAARFGTEVAMAECGTNPTAINWIHLEKVVLQILCYSQETACWTGATVDIFWIVHCSGYGATESRQ